MGRIHQFPFEDEMIPISSGDQLSNDNCYSILIGRNGVGKSRLLSEICFNYSKSYSEHMTFFAQDFVPSRIVALSTSPFDKFPVSRNRNGDFSRYNYVGMRSHGVYATNAMALIASAAKGLLEKYNENYRYDNFGEVFKLLNLEGNLSFIFKLGVKKSLELRPKNNSEIYSIDYSETGIELFTNFGEVDDSAFRELLDEREFLSYSNADSGSKFKIARALEYLWNYLETKKDALFKLDFDHRNKYSAGFSDKHMVECVLLLLNFGIVRLVDLKLLKNGGRAGLRELSLRRASSGEQCMLVIMLGIAGFIEDDSLILIDEPEISLHPSWQERFMELLIKFFSGYRGCHFIIATHSPQIVSRLAAENCYITVMGENKMYRASEYFHRSADYQLTELFDAPGIMNEYITRLAFGLIVKVKNQKALDQGDALELTKLINIRSKLEESDPNLDLINTVIEVCEYFKS